MENSWVHKTLGELFVFKNGLNKGKEYFGYGTPIINYMDVYKHPAIKKKYVQGRVTLSHQELDRFRVLKGDVFFTRTSETPEEVGMSATLLEDIPNCSFSGFVLRARPLTDLLIPEYCVYAFTAKEIRASIIKNCTYTTRALTNGRVLASLKLPIPSLAEQQRIASALSDADALVAELDVLIEKKRSIMAGTMQELLTGKRRLQGFDEPWSEEVLRNHLSFLPGFPFTSDRFSKVACGPRLIRNRDLHSDDQVVYYTGEYSNQYIIENGDLLIGMDGDFTPCLWEKGNAVLNQRVGRIICKNTANIVFLYYLLQKPLAELQKSTGATTVKHLSHSTIKNMVCRVPKLAEQHAIATILSDMDAEIAELEAKRDKYKEVRQGMMQQLLTGKIRLI